jgi:dodecin
MYSPAWFYHAAGERRKAMAMKLKGRKPAGSEGSASETETRSETSSNGTGRRHEHRTAKVVELVVTSRESFEDAVEKGLEDASQTTRGITGAHIENMSVKCKDGKIVEYKVNMKVAFGVERT